MLPAQRIIDTRPKYLLAVSDCQHFAIDLTYRIVVKPSASLAAMKTLRSKMRPALRTVSVVVTRVMEKMR